MTSYTTFNEVDEVDNLVKRLEEIPITLHTLDEILFAKIKHDKTRSDFRKNVTMKIGRDIRKKLADAGLKISRGERGDTAQRIKELEDEWRNIVKRLENMLSNEFMRGMVNMEDFNAQDMIKEFNDGREEQKNVLRQTESRKDPKKMSKKLAREYEMDEQDSLVNYSNVGEDHGNDAPVSLGGRKKRRRKTRKKKRRRTKKRRKKKRRTRRK